MNPSRYTAILAAIVVSCSISGVLHANEDVFAGHDLWTTPPGGAVETFGTGAEPIPAGFFGPGSDPFFGEVVFQGVPIELYEGQPTGGADTIVQRLDDANLPIVPSSDVIPIQLVQLQLTSVQPIVVTFNGGQNPTQFDVHVELGGPPSQGTMNILHTSPSGGVYDASINVCPLFTFVQVGNPGNAPSLDYCIDANPAGRNINVLGQPWDHDIAQPQQSPLSGPNFVVKGPTEHDGPHPKANPIELPQSAAVPSTGFQGLAALALLLVAVAGTILARRRWTA